MIFSAVVLALAIIVSGLLAAWIARGALKGLLSRTDRERKASAIATLVDVATEASVWNSLTPSEQVLSDRAVGQADIQLRLLPIKGAGAAANWASHQLAELKRNSATFGYQIDPAIAEFRDRLVEWQNRPSRAKKVFQDDLARWQYEDKTPDQALATEQDTWVAGQHHEKFAATSDASAAEPSVHDDTAPTVVQAAPAASAPLRADTQTQQLMDDVEALDARREAAQDADPVPAPIAAYPGRATGLDS
ncbi:MAG: hypothetical protein ABI255_05565 [Microbacteriaceae bacterium]